MAMTDTVEAACAAGLPGAPAHAGAGPLRRGAMAFSASVAGGVLSACGGGGSPTAPRAEPSAVPPGCTGLSAAAAAAEPACRGAAQPFEAMTPERAARLLAQGGLGATPAEVDTLVRDGAEAWFDAQVAMPVPASVWDWGLAMGFNNRLYARGDFGLDRVLWRRLSTAPDVLRQRVVLALSEIFVVSPLNMVAYWKQFACMAWWELLEQHCFGSFRSLLEAITLSPAMGVYLSMRGSARADGQGRQPDENYARELMQLFSIGLDALQIDGTPSTPQQATYNPDTVSELARVFTGWDVDGFNPLDPEGPFDYLRQPMDFHPERHDEGAKRLIDGRVVAAGTPGPTALGMALDALCAHPNVGPFIARQLIQRLVCSNPSPDYVRRVALVFNAADTNGERGNLARVVHAVLADPEARPAIRHTAATGTLTDGKLREPILRLLHWLRLAQVRSVDGQWAFPDLSGSDTLGQAPLRAPSVFNFFRPGHVPVGTGMAARGLVAPEFQITNESTVMGYANFLLAVMPFGAGGLEPDYARWLALADTPDTLVDQLALYLGAGTLSPATVSTLRSAVGSITVVSDTERRNRVVAAFFLIMTCPQYLVQR
ncbi:DUF1800 domain-containing protein [uncultured Aquabacterium sp.]|uniref:DUF1800 domain-containing protein n=1 Tax=uncultured Aquabacterium sp. TaxID=158753 RepID=UPI002610FC28|nr:DUF1800 domain-containing protein [uncultured Aquabacterium sp.]